MCNNSKGSAVSAHRLSIILDPDVWAMVQKIGKERDRRPGVAWRMTTTTRIISDAVEQLYRHEVEGEDIVRSRSMPDRG